MLSFCDGTSLFRGWHNVTELVWSVVADILLLVNNFFHWQKYKAKEMLISKILSQSSGGYHSSLLEILCWRRNNFSQPMYATLPWQFVTTVYCLKIINWRRFYGNKLANYKISTTQPCLNLNCALTIHCHLAYQTYWTSVRLLAGSTRETRVIVHETQVFYTRSDTFP